MLVMRSSHGQVTRNRNKAWKRGLRPLIDMVGKEEFLRQVIVAVGWQRFIDAIGIERFVQLLSPELRAELKRRLN